MSESTLNVLVSGLMGIFGGMITIPINALINGYLTRKEQFYQHQLDMIKTMREKQVQHQYDIELLKIKSAEDDELGKLKSEVTKLKSEVAPLIAAVTPLEQRQSVE